MAQIYLEGWVFPIYMLFLGLPSAPRIYSRLLNSFMAHLRTVGFTASIYIDGLLLLAPSREVVGGSCCVCLSVI